MNSFLETIELFLADHGIYMLTFVLMALGLFGMIFCSNYMKKIMCMNILQVSIILFFLTLGQKDGGTLPVIMGEITEAEKIYQSTSARTYAYSHSSKSGYYRSRTGSSYENKRFIRNH